jgi:hypothetical protein
MSKSVLALFLFAAAVAGAPSGLYTFSGEQGADGNHVLRRIAADGTSAVVGSANLHGTMQIAAHQTAIDPISGTMYMLALNQTGHFGSSYMLIGVSLDDASVTVEVATPLAQIGGYVGTGQTINYGGGGKIIVTGADAASGLKAAWSVDTANSTHPFSMLSSGFLNSTLPDRIDPAQALDATKGNLWVVPLSHTASGHIVTDLVGLDVATGAEVARRPNVYPFHTPHAMAFDAASGQLLAIGVSPAPGSAGKPVIFQIDLSTLSTKIVAVISQAAKDVLENGICAFDTATRTLYGVTGAAVGGDLLFGYSAATGTMTQVALDLSATDFSTMAFYAAPAK